MIDVPLCLSDVGCPTGPHGASLQYPDPSWQCVTTISDSMLDLPRPGSDFFRPAPERSSVVGRAPPARAPDGAKVVRTS